MRVRYAAALVMLALAPALRAEEILPISEVEVSTLIPVVPVHDTRLDRAHGFISRTYVRPLAWFDRFFMTEREEIETNRSFLRVVSGYEWVNRDGFDYRTRVRAKVRLPALQERLSLIVLGEEEDELSQAVVTTPQARETALAGTAVQQAERDDRVGFRYLLMDWLHSRIDVDATLMSELRGQVSARFRQRFPITERTLGRFSVNGFWLDRTGFGIRPRLEMERALVSWLGFLWSNQATHVEEGPGITWESRASLGAQLSPKDGASLYLTVAGPTRPSTVVQLYRAAVLYRRSFYRKWLAVELEPGYQWTRTPGGHYPPIATAAFRLEVRFQE